MKGKHAPPAEDTDTSMIIYPAFKLHSIVYLKTDIEQLPRLVLSYVVYSTHLSYELACGEDCDFHHEAEISKEKTIY